MHLMGANLMKFLSTLTAFMTVTAGVPSLQCRCPDGRIKHFYQGIVSSGCCCAGRDGSSANSSSSCCRSSCCRAKKSSAQQPQPARKHSCCNHPDVAPTQTDGGEGSRIEVKATGCEITLVADASNSMMDTGSSLNQLDNLLVLAEADPVLAPFVSGSTPRCPQRSLAPPPNLIICLCRFTC